MSTAVSPRLVKSALHGDEGSLASRQAALEHGTVSSDVIAGAITQTIVLHDLSKASPVVDKCLTEQLQSSQLHGTDREAVYRSC